MVLDKKLINFNTNSTIRADETTKKEHSRKLLSKPGNSSNSVAHKSQTATVSTTDVETEKTNDKAVEEDAILQSYKSQRNQSRINVS
jgi:hypothetical protein